MFIKFARLLARLLFVVVDARWFRGLCRPVVRLLRFRNPVGVRVDGHIMYARAIDSIALLFLYKFKANEYFERLLLDLASKPGMTAVDIGANLGYFTLALAEKAGPQGLVLAFEPEPSNHALLRKTLDDNGIRNVKLEQAAVSDAQGTCRLYVCEENGGDNRIFDSGDQRASVEVPMVTLDDYLQGRSLDVLKMDVQGAEARILRGMKETLRRSPGAIVLSEFSPSLIRQSGCQPAAFLDEMADLGFEMYYVDSHQRRLQRAVREKLLGLHQSHKDINLLFVRNLPESLNVYLER